MSYVIHKIKGNRYLYNHYRVGKRVVAEYVGPVGSGGGIRKPLHGGGRPRAESDDVMETLVDTAMTESDEKKLHSNVEKIKARGKLA